MWYIHIRRIHILYIYICMYICICYYILYYVYVKLSNWYMIYRYIHLYIYKMWYICIYCIYSQAKSQFWEAIHHAFFSNEGLIKLAETFMLHGRGEKMPAQPLSFLSLLSSCGLYWFMSGFVFLFLFLRGHNLADKPQDGAMDSVTKFWNPYN